jgi:hypothetical protein
LIRGGNRFSEKIMLKQKLDLLRKRTIVGRGQDGQCLTDAARWAAPDGAVRGFAATLWLEHCRSDHRGQSSPGAWYLHFPGRMAPSGQPTGSWFHTRDLRPINYNRGDRAPQCQWTFSRKCQMTRGHAGLRFGAIAKRHVPSRAMRSIRSTSQLRYSLIAPRVSPPRSYGLSHTSIASSAMCGSCDIG